MDTPNSTGISGNSYDLHHSYVGTLGVWNETGYPTTGAPVSNLGLYLMGRRWIDLQIRTLSVSGSDWIRGRPQSLRVRWRQSN